MEDVLDWYDSRWLRRYVDARSLISRVAPRRLSTFDNALAPLRTDPQFNARFMPGLFDADELEWLRETVRSIPSTLLELHEMKIMGRFVVHDLPEFTALQGRLVDTVSELAGEPVEPAYNFLAMYTRMGVCRPHLDAPKAKWTLDICIDQSDRWPIHFSRIVPWPQDRAEVAASSTDPIVARRDLDFRAVELEPGDAVFFSGSSQWHYRDPLVSDARRPFCDLLFLHYIPRGTAEVIQHRNWARMFDVPELAQIKGIDDEV